MAKVTALFPHQTKLGHEWKVYDEQHRACVRCGLRLFWSTGTNSDMHGGGWRMLDFYGVPSAPLLTSGDAVFGACTPHDDAQTVLIEYTGNPDRFPGCERIMHAIPPSSPGSGLLDLGAVMPLCRVKCEFWELGPMRKWPGWTWCQDCFPGHEPKHVLPEPEKALPPWPREMMLGVKSKKAKKRPKALPPKPKKGKR